MSAEPCRCHRSFAYVTGIHEGHCCFFPASQTCHPDEVAEWERERDRRQGRPELAPAGMGSGS